MPDLTGSDLTRQAIRVSGFTYTREFPENASQTFVPGDIVGVDSDGQVTIAVAAGSTLDSTGIRIVGRALKAASGTTNTMIPCEVWTTNTRINLPVYHSTAASAVTAQTTVDTQCNLRNDSTYGWVWDIETVTNPLAHLIGIPSSYDGRPMSVGGQYNPMTGKILGLELFDQS